MHLKCRLQKVLHCVSGPTVLTFPAQNYWEERLICIGILYPGFYIILWCWLDGSMQRSHSRNTKTVRVWGTSLDYFTVPLHSSNGRQFACRKGCGRGLSIIDPETLRWNSKTIKWSLKIFGESPDHVSIQHIRKYTEFRAVEVPPHLYLVRPIKQPGNTIGGHISYPADNRVAV